MSLLPHSSHSRRPERRCRGRPCGGGCRMFSPRRTSSSARVRASLARQTKPHPLRFEARAPVESPIPERGRSRRRRIARVWILDPFRAVPHEFAAVRSHSAASRTRSSSAREAAILAARGSAPMSRPARGCVAHSSRARSSARARLQRSARISDGRSMLARDRPQVPVRRSHRCTDSRRVSRPLGVPPRRAS